MKNPTLDEVIVTLLEMAAYLPGDTRIALSDLDGVLHIRAANQPFPIASQPSGDNGHDDATMQDEFNSRS